MDVSNDVMQFGLESFASKGLHKRSFQPQKGDNPGNQPVQTMDKSVTVQTMASKSWLLGCPIVSL